jgi:hypothetical protein
MNGTLIKSNGKILNKYTSRKEENKNAVTSAKIEIANLRLFKK